MSVRDAIVDAALTIVTDEGPAGLTVRRLAGDAGTSTMAVYTHFGGISGVTSAVVEHGFALLGTEMSSAPPTGDALSDLFAIALTYLTFARARPHLYTMMFQHPPTDAGRGDAPHGRAAFTVFLGSLTRTGADETAPITEPITEPDDDELRLALAAELWSALHGNAMLRIAGHLDTGDDTVARSLLVALAVGNGIDRSAAVHALDRATAATTLPPGTP